VEDLEKYLNEIVDPTYSRTIVLPWDTLSLLVWSRAKRLTISPIPNDRHLRGNVSGTGLASSRLWMM
jgi:hypothetical protein